MKHVRRTVTIVLVVIFCIALVISAAVATSVKNVNVTYADKTGAYVNAYEQTLENLQELKGGNILLVTEEDARGCVSDTTRLNLVSFSKTYPCTVNIELVERVETFYSLRDGVCTVYDENCEIMYTSINITGGSEDEGYVLGETNDGSPNVIIDDGLESDELSFIASACAAFKQSFGSLRQLVKSVARETTPESENLIFTLRSGLKVEISDCNTLTDEKIAAAFTRYSSLTDGQKTSGKVRAYTQESYPDVVRSVYTP